MKLRLTGGYDYGNGDGTAESYCFDDWGYLYVNTVTPDGYQVNELGAWVQDGEVYDYGNHLGSYGMPRLHRLEISRQSNGCLQVLGYIVGKDDKWVRYKIWDYTLYPTEDGIYKSLPGEDYFKNPYETYFIAEGDQLMTLSRYVEDVVVYTLYKKVQ
jgi:hypothetical protein